MTDRISNKTILNLNTSASLAAAVQRRLTELGIEQTSKEEAR